jgi:DNA polymerase-3 subunit alpha (Gram-positive type)
MEGRRMINSYIALDTETTGVNPSDDRIIEIGMARVIDGQIEASYSTLIDPQMNISARITELTGITDGDVTGKPVIADIIGEIIDFTQDLPLLGHNIIFDYKFIKKAAADNSMQFVKNGIDTLKMARRILPDMPHKGLEYLCAQLGINPGHSHRAYDDAVSAMQLYNRLYELAPNDAGFETAPELVFAVKKDVPATAAQLRYIAALTAKHNIELNEKTEGLTKSKASRIIDGIISTYGK